MRFPISRIVPLALIALAVACSESPVDVSPEEVPASGALASTSSSAIDVWWPTQGSWLNGTTPFKALLKGSDLSAYRMYWKVDGDRLNPMYDSYTGSPHKETTVDLSGWNWRGTGPYVLTFVAQDRNGQTIATHDVTIYVGTPPATGTAPAAPVGRNPFANAKLWVDPYSDAARQVDSWRVSRPADAEMLSRISRRPQAIWLGEWYSDIRSSVQQMTSTVTMAGALPVFVAYSIPKRDCGQYSAGGAASPDAYRAWIRNVADGIGSRRAVVILEPDAIALQDCLSATEQRERMALIADGIRVLKAKGGISVYIDAGNSRWHSAEEIARRLTTAGIAQADGFSLNIANYHTTASNVAFGEAVSRLTGGKHFVVDTGRNGLGPTAEYEWCNAANRGLGIPPTTSTGNPLVDAFLWIKRPGESDGTCNGGPSAGAWWPENALGLAARMPVTLASLP